MWQLILDHERSCEIHVLLSVMSPISTLKVSLNILECLSEECVQCMNDHNKYVKIFRKAGVSELFLNI